VTQKLALIAAGGTGGHMFPAEALSRVLAARGWRVVLASDSRGDVYAQNFPCEERLSLEAATFGKADPIGAVRAGVRILTGVRQAMAAIERLRPDVAVGFGGYPAFPALVGAKLKGVPLVIHEQNAVLGRVNRAIADEAAYVACAFPTLKRASAKTAARLVVVGNPVRPEIAALAERAYAPPDPSIRILVTGGSQGARLLSETVPRALAELPEALRLNLRVEQQTRLESMDFARQTYAEAGVEAEVAPFFRNMAARLEKAHLVIGRAGASTVSELAVAGLPSILVPLKIAMEDHQTWNARLLTDCGAAVAIGEDAFCADVLRATLVEMLSEPGGLARRAAAARSVAIPDSAERLADLVARAARG
jgi:UDP-N-acetylglucosamine--N-acetylmuramyl-(pentapeptide) pyrophosphoryl-undecaprenol N-acetylglucosamine transferase